MISEKGLCACMKNAWRAAGYIILINEDTVYIHTAYWSVQVEMHCLPRKALALMVEHIGTIPADFEAYKCSKDYGAQTVVAGMETETAEKIAARFALRLPEAKETQLTHKNCRIYQAPATTAIMAIDPDYLRLIDTADPGNIKMDKEKNLMLWEDDGCRIAVAEVKMQDAAETYLAGFPWVE